MKEKQRQVIKDFSSEIYNSYSSYEAFCALAEQWDLASNFERLLGAEGRISFPVERPQVDIGTIENELESLESVLQMVYDSERFSITVGAPSNKLEIAVWDNSENKQVVRRSYNKTLDYLYKQSQESKVYGFYSHSDVVYKADKIAQKLSQRSVRQKGTMYISALPEDILTASINNLGWSSCFDSESENSVTPYHLMRSRRTLIAFFIPDNAENETMDYCGHEVYNKYWRTFIYQSTDGSFFASSQSYPENSKALTIEALNKLIELDGREGTISDSVSARYILHGYSDGLRLSATFDHKTDSSYIISSPHQLCPLSGKPYIGELDQSITSPEYTEVSVCFSCGSLCHNDELGRVVVSPHGDTEDYCEWCTDDVSYCENSGESYTTEYDSDTASKFIDEYGNVSDILTHYAKTYLSKYTLTLYTDSETYETYQLYGEGVHSLLNNDQVEDIVGHYRSVSYRVALLTLDE